MVMFQQSLIIPHQENKKPKIDNIDNKVSQRESDTNNPITHRTCNTAGDVAESSSVQAARALPDLPSIHLTKKFYRPIDKKPLKFGCEQLTSCIKKWLNISKKPFCPLCRRNPCFIADTGVPLHYTAAQGLQKTIGALIARSANVNSRTKDGRTPPPLCSRERPAGCHL